PGEVREPELPHEEVVELEPEAGRDPRVRALLVRETDVEADGASARVVRAAVRGFHDARPAAATDEKAARRRRDLPRPLRDQARQLAGLLVVVREGSLGGEPGGAEEDDGVVDALPLERVKGLEVLGEDADRARGGAVEEGLVAIGEHGAGMVPD